MHINLLPRQYQIRLLLRARLRQWAFVWCGCAAVVSGLCLAKYRDLAAIRSVLDRTTRECAPLSNLEHDIVRLQKATKDSLLQADSMTALVGDHPWRLLHIVSRSVLDTQGRMQVQQFGFIANSPTAAATAPPSSAATPTARGSVVLQGIARDDLATARFVLGLRNAAFFESVRLRSSHELPSADLTLRHYEVECQY